MVQIGHSLYPQYLRFRGLLTRLYEDGSRIVRIGEIKDAGLHPLWVQAVEEAQKVTSQHFPDVPQYFIGGWSGDCEAGTDSEGRVVSVCYKIEQRRAFERIGETHFAQSQ